jgi:anti-sigma regulatory factor (Ser/Thr protein kinase)
MFDKYPAKLENLNNILDVINSAGEKANLSKKKLYQLRLISEEILVNIINYAYPDTEGDIFLKYEISEKKIDLLIKNKGIKFNPLEKELPDVNADLKDREAGGLGIFLVTQIANKVEYRYENSENILLISLEE